MTPEEPSFKAEIPDPNFEDPDAFNNWLDTYVQKPTSSYTQLKHRDGTPLSLEEQLALTRDQLKVVVRDFIKLDRSPEEINTLLKTIVIPLSQP